MDNDSTLKGKDNRQSARADFEVSIDVQSEDNFFAGITMNISSGGLFIATDTPLPIGEEVRVRFTVPTLREEVDIMAVVRWLRAPKAGDKDTPGGMGVEFKDLPPHVAKGIDDFINRQRQAIFFDS